MAKTSSRKLIDFFLIFAIVYLGTQMITRIYFPQKFGVPGSDAPVVLSLQDASIKSGHHPVLLVRNGTESGITLPTRCPEAPVDVWYAEQGAPDVSVAPVQSSEIAVPCEAITSVAAGKQVSIDLAPWKYALFEQDGNYAVRMTLPPQPAFATGAVLMSSFQIYPAGWPTQVFRAFVSKPLLNALIFIASITPGYNLGIAIIILTIIVKLLLYIPTQHSLEGQKKMQVIQPKIDELKRKYGSDQQKVNEETMKLWKEHKVNPFQSCLPLLVQFPILIGLFYAVSDGSHLALSKHLIYGAYRDLPWTFSTWFLGIDLLKPNYYIFPILLVGLQFLQMKLSFRQAAKKKASKAGVIEGKINGPKDKEKEEKGKKMPMSQAEIQQKVMLYALPLMIGFFAIKFPAAVALYWGASTIFAIVQQMVVNRRG